MLPEWPEDHTRVPVKLRRERLGLAWGVRATSLECPLEFMATGPASKNSSPMHPRYERCAATLECREVDRAPVHIPAIACDVSSALLGRPVHTGTGSLRYAEVAAWADGEAAHAEFEGEYLCLSAQCALDERAKFPGSKLIYL